MAESPTMSHLLDNLFRILGDVMDHYAHELYVQNEDQDLAISVDAEDSAIVCFRRGLMFLRAARVPISDRVLSLERRLERTYREGFGLALPPLGESDGVEFTRIIWEGIEGKD